MKTMSKKQKKNNMKSIDLNNAVSREPFSVPEGYFDNLTEQVMARIDQQEATRVDECKVKRLPFYKTEFYAKLKPYIYMAAMFGGLYFGIWIYKYQQRIVAEKAQTLAMQTEKDANVDLTQEEMAEYIDDACDYMMLDSHDIMAYVTDDE